MTRQHYQDMIYLHLRNNHAVLTQDNDVQVFNDGVAKFDALLKDLENAKDHIHFQYYILRLDSLGTRILDLLSQKGEARRQSSRPVRRYRLTGTSRQAFEGIDRVRR